MSEKFDYEVNACLSEDGEVAMCEESEADFWGVYERPRTPDDQGACLAVWIADFSRKEDAQAFAALLTGNQETEATPMFKLNIGTGNAAFTNCKEEEVARILYEAADKLRDGYDTVVLRDGNGNLVGTASFVGE